MTNPSGTSRTAMTFTVSDPHRAVPTGQLA